jgi:hypothetical protein
VANSALPECLICRGSKPPLPELLKSLQWESRHCPAAPETEQLELDELDSGDFGHNDRLVARWGRDRRG